MFLKTPIGFKFLFGVGLAALLPAAPAPAQCAVRRA